MICPRHQREMVERTLELLPGAGIDGRWLLCPVNQCATAHLIEILTPEDAPKC